jgi:hypothetical protein
MENTGSKLLSVARVIFYYASLSKEVGSAESTFMRAVRLMYRRFPLSGRQETADVSLAATVLYWVGRHVSALRTDHFGARTRSAKPVSNQRRICAQKTCV